MVFVFARCIQDYTQKYLVFCSCHPTHTHLHVCITPSQTEQLSVVVSWILPCQLCSPLWIQSHSIYLNALNSLSLPLPLFPSLSLSLSLFLLENLSNIQRQVLVGPDIIWDPLAHTWPFAGKNYYCSTYLNASWSYFSLPRLL